MSRHIGTEFSMAMVGRDGFNPDALVAGANVAGDSVASLGAEAGIDWNAAFNETKGGILNTGVANEATSMMDFGNSFQEVAANALAGMATLLGVDKGVQAMNDSVNNVAEGVKQGGPNTTMNQIRAMVAEITVASINSFRHIAEVPNGNFHAGAKADDVANKDQLGQMRDLGANIAEAKHHIAEARATLAHGGKVPEGEPVAGVNADAKNDPLTPGGAARSLAAGAFAGVATGAILGSGPIGVAVAAVTAVADMSSMVAAFGRSSWKPETNTPTATVAAAKVTRAEQAEARMASTSGGGATNNWEKAAGAATAGIDMAAINETSSSVKGIAQAPLTQTAELDKMAMHVRVQELRMSPQLARAESLDEKFRKMENGGQTLDLEGALVALNHGVKDIRRDSTAGFVTAMG